jgi:hypothetical protein
MLLMALACTGSKHAVQSCMAFMGTSIVLTPQKENVLIANLSHTNISKDNVLGRVELVRTYPSVPHSAFICLHTRGSRKGDAGQ